jgi:hypothetical protein
VFKHRLSSFLETSTVCIFSGMASTAGCVLQFPKLVGMAHHIPEHALAHVKQLLSCVHLSHLHHCLSLPICQSLLPGPSLHLPLEVNGMNIWQVLQGKVQLPKGAAPARQLQQNQQQELLQQQQASAKAPAALQAAEVRPSTATAALEQQQSPAAVRLLSPQACAAPTLGQLSSKDGLPSCVVQVAGNAAGTEVFEVANAVDAAAAGDNCAPCTVTSASFINPGSSSNVVSVQLRVLQDGRVRLQLAVPCAVGGKTAAAFKQQLIMEAVGAASQPTHYTPTVGMWRL